jgi:hypothetical protein
MFNEYKINSILTDIEEETVGRNDTQQQADRYKDIIQYLCYSMAQHNEQRQNKINYVQLIQNYHSSYAKNDMKRKRDDTIDYESRPWKKVRMMNGTQYSFEFLMTLLEMIYKYIEVDQIVSKTNNNNFTNAVVLNKYIYERRERLINMLTFNTIGDISSRETCYIQKKNFPMITRINFNCDFNQPNDRVMKRMNFIASSMSTPEFTKKILSVSIKGKYVPCAHVGTHVDFTTSTLREHIDSDYTYLAKLTNLNQVDIYNSNLSVYLFLLYLPKSVTRINYCIQNVNFGSTIVGDFQTHLAAIGESENRDQLIENHPNPELTRKLVEIVETPGSNLQSVFPVINQYGIASFDELVFHQLSFTGIAALGSLMNNISIPNGRNVNERIMAYNVKRIIFKDCIFNERSYASLKKRALINPNDTMVEIFLENITFK